MAASRHNWCRIIAGALSFVILPAMGGQDDRELALQVRDNTLLMQAVLSFSERGKDGPRTRIGEELKCRIKVSNISSKPCQVPDAAHCLDVRLERPSSSRGRSRGEGDGHIENLMKPGDFLEFERSVTVLYPEVNLLTITFRNSTSRIHVPHTEATEGGAVRHLRGAKALADAWMGTLHTNVQILVEDDLTPRLSLRYAAAAQKVGVCEVLGPAPLKYKRASNGGKMQLSHDNVTQQSEVLDLIRSVAADGNSHSVKWLWARFGETGKNSPAHLAIMDELYWLLCRGIGAEHAEKFLATARASAREEAIATRLYALDATSLIAEKDYLVCVEKGNNYYSELSADLRERAGKTIKALSLDRMKDVRTRAEQILGIHKSTEKTGTRKYIKPGNVDPTNDPFL